MLKLNKYKLSGQTLVEAMVAITMVVIVAIGAYGVITQSIKISRLGKERMVAQGYMQDGLEKIRNIRDNNLKELKKYDENIGVGQVRIQNVSSGNSFKAVAAGPNGEDLGNKINRNIIIDNSLPNTLLVTVKITWKDGKDTYSTSCTEKLTDWTK